MSHSGTPKTLPSIEELPFDEFDSSASNSPTSTRSASPTSTRATSESPLPDGDDFKTAPSEAASTSSPAKSAHETHSRRQPLDSIFERRPIDSYPISTRQLAATGLWCERLAPYEPPVTGAVWGLSKHESWSTWLERTLAGWISSPSMFSPSNSVKQLVGEQLLRPSAPALWLSQNHDGEPPEHLRDIVYNRIEHAHRGDVEPWHANDLQTRGRRMGAALSAAQMLAIHGATSYLSGFSSLPLSLAVDEGVSYLNGRKGFLRATAGDALEKLSNTSFGKAITSFASRHVPSAWRGRGDAETTTPTEKTSTTTAPEATSLGTITPERTSPEANTPDITVTETIPEGSVASLDENK